MKAIAQAVLTIVAIASFVLMTAQAETALGQVALTLGAGLALWLSSKGLERIWNTTDQTNK